MSNSDHKDDIVRWLRDDWRSQAIHEMLHYLNCEAICGDVLEFGVAGGRGLCLLAYWHNQVLTYWGWHSEAAIQRQFVGFDSFQGLPDTCDHHPRMKTGVFAFNEDQTHPLILPGSPHTPEIIYELFRRMGFVIPTIIEGDFDDTLDTAIPLNSNKAALVHIDCDYYESTLKALFAIEPILQDGAIIAFDDWFCFKANPHRGEARAMAEFLKVFPHWQAVSYKQYSVYCHAFIMVKQENNKYGK